MSLRGAKRRSHLKNKGESIRVIQRAKPEGSRLKWLSVYWFPTLLWAGVIFYLSHLPVEELPSWEIPYLDKVVHAIEFGILTLLCLRSFVATYPSKSIRFLILLTFAVVFSYALQDEYHQSFIAGRITDVYDLLADTTGIIIALLLLKK